MNASSINIFLLQIVERNAIFIINIEIIKMLTFAVAYFCIV